MSQPIPIPAYDFPCLIQSTATPSKATTFYLIGAQENILELCAFDIGNINNQSCQKLQSDHDNGWRRNAPKLCFNYAGSGSFRTHVQQFSIGATYDANIMLVANATNVTVTYEKPTVPTGAAPPLSFLSPKQFAIVGQAGNIMYGVGNTDGLGTVSSWYSLVVTGAAQVNSTRQR